AFKVLNDSQAFNSHFQLLVGFIYDCDDITTKNRYSLCSNIKKIFNYIAHDKQLTLDEVQLSSIKMTEDTSSCLLQFRNLKIDKTKADYLNGWQVVS
ncbi:hypothetical protein EAY19_26475, partial [Vibrio anguillarum]|nr:hypothetical protein [Vibrio anguillarum]